MTDDAFAEALGQDPRLSTANPLFADVEHPERAKVPGPQQGAL